NFTQIGKALHVYHEQHGYFRTSGESSDPLTGATVFAKHSMFTELLPFVEHGEIYTQIDPNYVYNDNAAGANHVNAFKNVIPSFLCPTNPIRPKSGVDSAGFGYCDYMPVAYV